MTCQLCRVNEADKKNTHFLTDAIIRTALNQGGSNIREKGLYFDLSNNIAGVQFNFQRNTDSEEIKSHLNRDLTEEEIDQAKQIPFSVDNKFCGECEKLFTKIETEFVELFLSRFRNKNLDVLFEIRIPETESFRIFFLMQIWRTAVSTIEFNFNNTLLEQIRISILNYKTVNLDEIKAIPLSVTYLQTKGEAINYSSNLVGYTSDMCPSILLMNDFVIQVYEGIDKICFNEIHGLNVEDKFRDFINIEEAEFIVPILHDAQRINFNSKFMMLSKFEPLIEMCKNKFILIYKSIFNTNPQENMINNYIASIVGNDISEFEKYSDMQLKNKTIEYVKSLFKK